MYEKCIRYQNRFWTSSHNYEKLIKTIKFDLGITKNKKCIIFAFMIYSKSRKLV